MLRGGGVFSHFPGRLVSMVISYDRCYLHVCGYCRAYSIVLGYNLSGLYRKPN